MSTAARQRSFLLELVVDAIGPVMATYSGGTVNGAPDVERAIDRTSAEFGDRIVTHWLDWLRNRSQHEAVQVLVLAATLSPEEARHEAALILERKDLRPRPEDRAFALDYLARIPGLIQRTLVFDRSSSSFDLPLDFSLHNTSALRRLLPDAEDLKGDWHKHTHQRPNGSQLQTQPDAPHTVLPALTAGTSRAEPPPVPLTMQHGPVLTKLRLLARCHALVYWRWWKRLALFVLLIIPCLAAAIGAGFATHEVVYEDPPRDAQQYWSGFGEQTYYIRGEKVTRQEYDYYLSTSDARRRSAQIRANVWAVGGSLVVFILLYGVGVFLIRWLVGPVRTGLDEQIAAIVKLHPDAVQAWGGPAVLHQRALVEELAQLESGDPR
jgi:hypothetical protein